MKRDGADTQDTPHRNPSWGNPKNIPHTRNPNINPLVPPMRLIDLFPSRTANNLHRIYHLSSAHPSLGYPHPHLFPFILSKNTKTEKKKNHNNKHKLKEY